MKLTTDLQNKRSLHFILCFLKTMSFTENIKLEAKQRSHFQCAICRQPFVEVHHIKPQAEGGLDTIENACPLCGSCHDLFGANPDKRKQLGEMRDFQWEINAKKQQHPDTVSFNEKLDGIQIELNRTAQSQAAQERILSDMKSLMISHNNSSNAAISRVTSLDGLSAATGVYIPPPKN